MKMQWQAVIPAEGGKDSTRLRPPRLTLEGAELAQASQTITATRSTR
jgi:hypothetical protein